MMFKDDLCQCQPTWHSWGRLQHKISVGHKVLEMEVLVSMILKFEQLSVVDQCLDDHLLVLLHLDKLSRTHHREVFQTKCLPSQ